MMLLARSLPVAWLLVAAVAGTASSQTPVGGHPIIPLWGHPVLRTSH
jgi:hypothetical protein